MREARFTFLCNPEERQALARLSAKLDRTQSDAVRWLIREAERELTGKPGSKRVASELAAA